MPERKILAKIIKITDDDTGMYQIGEIDGGFSDDELLEYINQHGEYGLNQLISRLSYLQFQVWSVWLKYTDNNATKAAKER